MNIKHFIREIIFEFFKLFPIDQHSIILESEGDCTDNAYALFDYMRQNGYLGKYKITWLVTNLEKFNIEKNINYVSKSFRNLNTIKALSTCKYYIYDHNNFLKNKKRKGQIIVNLWHGCGVKTSNYFPGKSNIDILISTSSFFDEELSKIFGVDKQQIKPVGYPRSDYFFEPLNECQYKVKKEFERYKKVVLWMPTFRRSKNKNLDEDYFKSYTGLPIVENEQELLEFDNFLSENNTFCIFKIHHLQADLPAMKHQFKNISIINDEDIHKMGLQLYQYVMLVDFLITDYSSIATDFMLLDKPIIYTVDDYEQYNKSRGFAFDNTLQYFAGYQVKNYDEFCSAIIQIQEGKDIYRDERHKVNKIFNCYQDGNNSKKILHEIGILK